MEAVGRLAGGVAHDFNNLITVILGYAAMIEKRLPAADTLQWPVGEISKAAERAASLTSQLLTFSRKQAPKAAVVDLKEWMESARDLLERLIGEDIELRVMLHGTACTVKADSSQLTQILMNLAVNARDAMELGGKLTIDIRTVWLERMSLSRPGGEYVVLSVTDTGQGFDADTAAHIFDPFFTTKGPDRGTGLGLSTVYGILTQQGGWIDVRSQPGAGTTFDIYLPRVEAEEALDAVPEPVLEIPRRKAKVLLVEDQAGIRRLVEMVLVDAGYEVLSATHGDSALSLLEERDESIDMLVTDVILPGMSGPILAQRLRRKQPDLKVLFMSGYADDALEDRGAFEPGTFFLAKPFLPEQLVVLVGEALRSGVPVDEM